MIKYYIFYPLCIALLLMFSFKVFAEDLGQTKEVFTGDVWQNFCASYQAGIDVHRKPVVKADLTESVIIMPTIIEFDLDMNLAEYLGLPTQKTFLGEAKTGHIKVENNKVYFNEKLVENDEKIGLDNVCKRLQHTKVDIENKASYTDLSVFGEKNDSGTKEE